MRRTIEGRLGFNSQNGRYGILISDLWENDGLHCGECLEWYNSETGEWVSDRIEGIYPADNPDNWYLVEGKIKGKDLEYTRVRY